MVRYLSGPIRQRGLGTRGAPSFGFGGLPTAEAVGQPVLLGKDPQHREVVAANPGAVRVVVGRTGRRPIRFRRAR